MSNLRNEVRCIKTAKETLRKTFDLYGLKAIDYLHIPELGYEGEVVKLSRNIFAYILKECPERKKVKRVEAFCNSPDMDFKEFLG